MKSCALASLVLAACTVNNPNFTGNGGDGGVTIDAGRDGTIGDHDLSMIGGHDLSLLCPDGERACSAGTQQVSAVCMNNAFVPDRFCPDHSSCVSGYCAPPPANGGGRGEPCDGNGNPQEVTCLQFAQTLSCQPFVDPGSKQVSWFCDTEVGMGVPGTTCTTGKECRTGFCGSNGTCFRSCTDLTECPNNGVPLQCAPVQITVEGVQVTANSCIPIA